LNLFGPLVVSIGARLLSRRLPNSPVVNQIIVNGKPFAVPEHCTVAALLQQLHVTGRFAVEVNEEIVPRSRHSSYELKADDHVEIVQAIGGG